MREVGLKGSALVWGVLLVSCTSTKTEVLESTTTAVPPGEEITATSADQRLALKVKLGGLDDPATITVRTRRDLVPAGSKGLVYEVTPSRTIAPPSPATLTVSLEGWAQPSALDIARVDGSTLVPLDAAHDGDRLRLQLPVVEHAMYALVTSAPDPCAGLACGEPCTIATSTSACAGNVCRADGTCGPSLGDCTIEYTIEGWDAPPGAGRAFVINRLAIAPATMGFDLDGTCASNTDVRDNRLWQLGELGNDLVRQGLLGGESLLTFEIAGLDDPFLGDDHGAVLKSYVVQDADHPFFPANNFKVPPGETDCCRFEIDPLSLDPMGHQARSRAPVRIENGFVSTMSPIPLVVRFGPATSFTLERALIHARIPSNVSELTDGLIGGVLTARQLATVQNPFCRTVSPRCTVQLPGESSMLDLVAVLLSPSPDQDLDGDGLEQVVDSDGDGLVDHCYDGCVGACTQPEEIPNEPGRPGSCVFSPRLADGYSIALTFTAVPATLVGVASPTPYAEGISTSHPIGGRVHVETYGGRLGWTTPWVRVTSASGAVTAPIASGAKYFATLPATVGETLTIDALWDEPGTHVFDTRTVVVPAVPYSSSPYFCCGGSSPVCTSLNAFEQTGECAGAGATACTTRDDCDTSTRLADLPFATFDVRAPEDGVALVSGDLATVFEESSESLVRILNGAHQSFVFTEGWTFSQWIPAASGDQISVLVSDYRGNRAVPVMLTVP